MIRNFTEHASNERTFLAWVRTVIAIEGFGIAAARMTAPVPSIWADVLLLGIGGLVIFLAYLRMRSIRKRIDEEAARVDDATGADALLLFLIVALFSLLAVFGLRLG